MAKDLATQSRALAREEKAHELMALFEGAGIPFQDPSGEDSLEAALDIALRISRATTAEEVLNPAQTVSGKDMIGKRFRITGEIVGRHSTFQGGIGWYLQFPARVTDPQTGELSEELVSVGALNVMVQLAKLKQLGALDQDFRLLETEKETERGFKPLWLYEAV